MVNRRGVSIIENMVAMVLFTAAFIFTVYSLANLVTPLLEREEAADMQLIAYNSIERIISDPEVGLAREDHVLSFDKLSIFLINEEEKYEEAKDYLGLEEYSFKIIVASTFSRVSTYGIQKGNTNSPYVIDPSLPGAPPCDPDELVCKKVENYADLDDDGIIEYKYNIEDFVIGDKKYTILLADSTNDGNVNYDRLYIDYDQDDMFIDEKYRNFGNLKEGESFAVEGFKYTIISIYSDEVELLEQGSVDMELGEELPYTIEQEGRIYLLNKPVVVISRLVLVVSEGSSEIKRLVFMIW
ncbi:MAG: hypothetical protein KAT49_01980 [Methanomicrobia archaeon]|nr:hypothetical protein [Methanomicrobia archaeon]